MTDDFRFWESYNRMVRVAALLKERASSFMIKNPRILDVGGATGENLLSKFLSFHIETADIAGKPDIIASAESIPVADESYDFVTCIDTLEHIPKEKRGYAVSEFLRIARYSVVIVAPADFSENNQAEELVLQHDQNQSLREHRKFGLVDFDTLGLPLNGRSDLSVSTEEIDNLMVWAVMMLGMYVERSELYRKLYFLENRNYFRRRIMMIDKRVEKQRGK